MTAMELAGQPDLLVDGESAETRVMVSTAIANSGLRACHRQMLWFILANATETDWHMIAGPFDLADIERMTGYKYSTFRSYLRTLEALKWIEFDCEWDHPFPVFFIALTPPPAAFDGPMAWIRCGEPSPGLKRRIRERDGHRCVLCQSTTDLSIDHIIPRIYGGTNDEQNLRTLCRSCNSSKGVSA